MASTEQEKQAPQYEVVDTEVGPVIEDLHRDRELAWYQPNASREQAEEVARRANAGEVTL